MASGPRVRCKLCGNIIQSFHRHDWKTCKCKSVFVDGGSDYLRVGWPDGKNKEDCLEVLKEKENGK